MPDALYNLDKTFERRMVVLCCSGSAFYSKVGHALNPALLAQAPCALAVKAAQAVAKDIGHGPTDPSIVIQRLNRWREEGKVTHEEIEAVSDLLFENSPLPEAEAIKEVAPILQKRMREQAVREALSDYQANGDFSKVVETVHKANRIGERSETIGTVFGVDSFAEIEKIRHLSRLPTGILELDVGLRGGLPRSQMGLFIAGTSCGKSMWLVQQAAEAMLRGFFVGYITLELSKAIVLARLKANLIGLPIDEILESEDTRARKIIENLAPQLGTFVVEYMPPKGVTVLDIIDWVRRCNLARGRKMDLLCIDYIDEVQSQNMRESTYEAQGTTITGFRTFIESEGMWGWTACAARRRDTRQKGVQSVTTDDVGESLKKPKAADVVITGAVTPDNDQVYLACDKNRTGKGKFKVGPFPTMWELGRICAVNRLDDLFAQQDI
jgi:hypothetical protein